MVAGGDGRGSAGPGWRAWLVRLRAARLPVLAVVLVTLAAFAAGVLSVNVLNPVGGPAGEASATALRGEGWGLFGKPRRADAPRRGIPRPETFAVWETRIDTTGAEPVACIRMSRPLDPSRSYRDFVAVFPEADAHPAVSVRGEELCIGGLGFTDRRITLLRGLRALDGETLAEDAEVPISFGDQPPYVGFAGGGVILPREEADGVGIETVNVSRLGIEVWRVADRNLVRKSISAPEPTAEGEWADDWGADSPNDEGVVVWKGEIAVKGDPGRRVTTVFPLGAVLNEMKPGGYVIKARDVSGGRGLKTHDSDYDPNPPAQARRWVMFTDMALTGYDGAGGLDVIVRSLKTARTLPGLRVALVARNGEDLAEGKTDAVGHVRFDRPLLDGEDAGRAKMVMAYGPQGDLAVLDLDRAPADLSRQDIAGRTGPGPKSGAKPVDAFLYADRGIYRPGETVHLNALLRDAQTKAVKDRKGAIVLRRPSGVEFARYRFNGTPIGAAAASVPLPKAAPRGRWRATVELEGIEQPVGEAAFEVQDFAPQRLAVTVSGREQVPLRANETRLVDVTARFLYGAAGAGLQTQGEARLRADPNPFPQYKDFEWGDQREPFEEKFLDLDRTVTDGDGRALLHLSAFAAHDTTQPLEAELTASVFEPGGRLVREAVKFKVRTAPVYLGAKVDQGQSSGRGDPLVSMDVIAVDTFGRRVAAPVQYSLISETWNYDWFQQGGRWQWRRTSRDVVVQNGTQNVGAGGAARIARRLGWGDYRLELTGPGGARSVIRFASGWGAPAKDVEAPDVVRLSAGVGANRQGDTVDITLKAPYAGEAQLAVATDRLIDFKTVSVGPNGGTVRLKTDASWGGGAYVLVSVIQPRDPVASPKPRRALGVLYVPLDVGSRKLDVQIGTPAKVGSRAMLEVPVTVKGKGFGGRARVTVAAVDEGILRITRFQSPDPVSWYFGKRALMLNYRDDYGRLLDPNLGAPANVNFGGDEVGGEGLTVAPIRTVALWSGLVETDASGRAVVRLPAPDFNGELRLMAVAWTDDAVGGASRPLTVREPVVAELSLPRFLAPGDKAFATLELHNVEGRAGVYLGSLVSQGWPLAQFRKLFTLAVGQRIVERIPFLAPRRAGIGQIALQVSGPRFAQTHTYPIQTRLGWGRITRTTVELQRPGETYTPPASLLSGLAAGDATMQVSYSPFRGFDPAPIAADLSRYPYGCTEQLVSSAYPLLYAREFAPEKGDADLNQAVSRLLDRQSMDGAFGLWRVGDAEADPWLGAYVTDFLLEARKMGAPIPAGAVERALVAMRQVSRPQGWAEVAYRMNYPEWWAGSKDASKKATEAMRRRASAYALYVLAKGGQGDLPRLRWWHDVQMKSEPAPLPKAQVAAGLAMMGDHARARSAFQLAVASIGYKDNTDFYQSPLRDLSAIVALAYEAGEVDLARSLQTRLENAVKNPDALNTQEEARLLQAAHYMLRASGQPQITAQGVAPQPGPAAAPRFAVGRLADARFTNAGRGPIWRMVTVTGAPVAAPSPNASGLTISKTLLSLGGHAVDPARLRQGDRVIVLITGRSLVGRTTALVVDDPLPAGFEIEAVLGADDAQNGPFRFVGKLTEMSTQEARDDRFVAASELPGNASFTVAYIARAVTPGNFLLPGAEARDMYRASTNARTAARRTVIAPGS